MTILESLDSDGLNHSTFGAIRSIYSQMLRVLVSFKSSAFAEECEWRFVDLVIRGSAAGPVSFTNVDGMMKPYQVLLTGSKANEKLPIVEVLAGASRYETEAMTSARLMLRRFGYAEVPVRPSRVPLRV